MPNDERTVSQRLGTPGTRPFTPSSITQGTEAGTSPLWSALASEAAELERSIARAGQAVSMLGILLAIFVALLVAPAMGWASAVFGVATLGWFTLLRHLLLRGVAEKLLRWAAPVLEMLLAAAALLIISATQGPLYAAGSWVPPQLFGAFIVFSLLRMHTLLPLVMGVVAAVAYWLIWWLVIEPGLPVEHQALRLAQPSIHVTRSISLVMVGGFATATSYAIRRAVRHAESAARARDLFGKYRLGREIASGGMGSVVKATYCPEGGFERSVAIKRVHPHLARDPRLVGQFRSEAELSARLLHPNIVSVFDFGRVDDTYFYAMEFVDGANLRDVMRRVRRAGERIPGRIVALIGREIAEGLAFAHGVARGSDGRLLRVVHRDLSPNNVLVSSAGQVKITDFGIARVLHDAGKHHTEHLTGKLSYMAPEQARGEGIDERVDLFALGIVLWEMLALRPLFTRNTQAATVLAVIDAEIPSPLEERGDIHDAWSKFFDLALERERGGRFQSAAEMRDALDAVLEAEGVPRPDELRAWLATLPSEEDPVALPGDSDPEATTMFDEELAEPTQPLMSAEATRPER